MDLNELLKNHPNCQLNMNFSPVENGYDAKIRRTKEIGLFIAAVLMVSSTFILCGYLILSNDYIDDKKWASPLLIGIITGLLGYLTGKKQ